MEKSKKMKTTKFFMQGLVIFGILMLMGGASATVANPDTINLFTPTNINITVGQTNVNVTLDGAGITGGPLTQATVGVNTWVFFANVEAKLRGQILVTEFNATATIGTTTIQAGSVRRSRRYMDYSYTPEEPLAGEELTLEVVDRVREDPLDDVEVDVFLNGKKIAYGLTDNDGLFVFTPAEIGDYAVKMDKTDYHLVEFSISVASEAAATTTTTTLAATTTTLAATTPTLAPVTTTTMAVEDDGGLPIVWILLIVVILIVVAFVAMKGKGGAEETEEETEEETAEDTTSGMVEEEPIEEKE